MLMQTILISRMADTTTAMMHSTPVVMITISITTKVAASIRASQKDAEILKKTRKPSATLQ